MKTIRITCGTYGYRRENGHIEPKRAGDIIEVPDSEAERIIRRKVGVIVTAEAVATSPVAPGDNGQGMDTPPADNAGEGQEMAHLDPEQLKTMTNPQLTEMGVEMGIDASALKGKNKAQLIEAILAVEVAVPDSEGEDDQEDDGEEPPEGKVEDIVV